MTYYVNRPSQLSLANDTTATTGNTGSNAGAVLTPVTSNGGTITYQSGRWRFRRGASSSSARLQLALEPSVRYSVEATFEITGTVTLESRILMLMNGSSTYAALLTISTSGTLRVHNNANQIVYQTSAIPSGQFRVHLGVEYGEPGLTNGKIRFNAYVGANVQGTTPDYTFSSDEMNTGSVLLNSYWVGHANNGANGQDMFLHSLQADSTKITALTPLATGTPSAQATATSQSYSLVDARSSSSGGGSLTYAISPSTGVISIASGYWAVPRGVNTVNYTVTVTDTTSGLQGQAGVNVTPETGTTEVDFTGYTQTLVKSSGEWT